MEIFRRATFSASSSSDSGSGSISVSTSRSSSNGDEDEEYYLAAGVFTLGLICAVLVSIFVSSSRFFRKWLHESLAILVLGVAIGAMSHFVWGTLGLASLQSLFAPGQFSRVFYAVLFPFVIFNAGFTLKQRQFMRNIGSISTYAFVGTVFSSIVTGTLLWLAGRYSHIGSADPIECLVFGALLSCTDTVATMAVLIEINV
jgi:NhaP-type Na+/H+ or K+/H+ antiporter